MNTNKQIFSKLSIGKYIPKDDKSKLEELGLTLVNTQKLCEELRELINKNKLSKKSYESIKLLLEVLDNEDINIQDTSVLLEEIIKSIENDLLDDKLYKEIKLNSLTIILLNILHIK